MNASGEPLATIDALQAENARLTSEVSRLEGALRKVKVNLDKAGKSGLHKYDGHIHAQSCAACLLRDYVASELPVAAALAPQEANDEEDGNE